jgi:hypothetical protein
VPENGFAYVIRLKTDLASLKLTFLGRALSTGNRRTGICPFSFEDGNGAKLLSVIHSESVVYINQNS